MVEDLNRVIGERIRQLRERKGLSQRGLAARSGVAQTVLSRIERGQAVTASDLAKIAKELDVTVLYFYPDSAPLELTDEEIALISMYQKLEPETKEVIYGQVETALRIQKELLEVSGEPLTEKELESMLTTGDIPPNRPEIYEVLSLMLTAMVGGNKDDILPLLKSGGVYETERGKLLIYDPETRIKRNRFMEFTPKL